MNKFIRVPFASCKNILQLSSVGGKWYIVPRAGFTTAQVNASTNAANKKKKQLIYTDKHKLSEEEINQILRKPKSRPNILVGTQIEREDYKAMYEKSIEEQLGTARFNTVKQFNELMEKSQKIEIAQPEIRPSDRPDVKYYKYDLPIPNIDPEIEGLDDIFERERKKRVTVNQNVWEVLALNADSSYENYEKALQAKFNFEMDMYGDIVDVDAKREAQLKALGEEVLPMSKINNEKYMKTLVDCFTLNINMPGTLENEDPNKMIRNLRPVEEFRHTPLIPISEKAMADYRRRLEEYHRGGLFFEVKKDTLLNYGMFIAFALIGYQLLNWLMEKEEEMGVNYERMKIRRMNETP